MKTNYLYNPLSMSLVLALAVLIQTGHAVDFPESQDVVFQRPETTKFTLFKQESDFIPSCDAGQREVTEQVCTVIERKICRNGAFDCRTETSTICRPETRWEKIPPPNVCSPSGDRWERDEYTAQVIFDTSLIPLEFAGKVTFHVDQSSGWTATAKTTADVPLKFSAGKSVIESRYDSHRHFEIIRFQPVINVVDLSAWLAPVNSAPRIEHFTALGLSLVTQGALPDLSKYQFTLKVEDLKNQKRLFSGAISQFSEVVEVSEGTRLGIDFEDLKVKLNKRDKKIRVLFSMTLDLTKLPELSTVINPEKLPQNLATAVSRTGYL